MLALIGSWMAHPSQRARHYTTRGAHYSYTVGIIILFSHSFQYSVYLPLMADAVVTWEFSPCHRQTQTLCWHWRMNDACFCRPACPLSLSCKNRWSAVWHSWVDSVEQGMETILSFSHILGSQRIPRAFLPGGFFTYCPELNPSSLLQLKLWLILVATALSLAVSTAPWSPYWSQNGFVTQLLVTFLHLIQLSCLHSPGCTHDLNRIFPNSSEEDFLWCPMSVLPLCPFFPQGSFVALAILRHLTMV